MSDDVKQQALKQAQQAYGLFIWFVKWFSYIMITLIIIMFMNNWFDDGTGLSLIHISEPTRPL